ncbi:MAG TPA: hypothetical protein VGX37_08240 [Allosphingosinicella sp.]|nr:hypothetical protein [Allosphingosinicella sp.]
MIRKRAILWLSIAIAADGCGSPTPANPEAPARRPPQQACEQARTSLERDGAGGGLMFEESGTAMIERDAWLRLGEAGREQVIERLAVLAGCSSPSPQREVEVVVRSGSGSVLERRLLRPSTDFRSGR